MLIVYRQMVLIGVAGTLVLALTLSDMRASFSAIPHLNGWAMGGYVFTLVAIGYFPYATVGFALRSGVSPPLIAAHIVYQPVFAAIIGEVALGTLLKWYQYLGGAVAAGAVLLIVYHSLKHKNPLKTPPIVCGTLAEVMECGFHYQVASGNRMAEDHAGDVTPSEGRTEVASELDVIH